MNITGSIRSHNKFTRTARSPARRGAAPRCASPPSSPRPIPYPPFCATLALRPLAALRTLPQVLQERLFGPLGLAHTTFAVDVSPDASRARGYLLSDGDSLDV